MKVIPNKSITVNNVKCKVLALDTYVQDEGSLQLLKDYNHLEVTAGPEKMIKAGFKGGFRLFEFGLPAVPVGLYGKKQVNVNSISSYLITTFSNEEKLSISVDNGTLTILPEGIAIQAPATTGVINVEINDYRYVLNVVNATATDNYPASSILFPVNGIAIPDTNGFGGTISISGDGNYLAVRATGADIDNNAVAQIEIYKKEFVNSLPVWTHQASLLPTTPDSLVNYGFGNSISLDYLGETVVVGNFGGSVTANGVSQELAGDIYTYNRTGNTWSSGIRFTMDESDVSPGLTFGYSLDISSDGLSLVISAPYAVTPTSVHRGNLDYVNARVIKMTRANKNVGFSNIVGVTNTPSGELSSISGINILLSPDGSRYFTTYSFNDSNEVRHTGLREYDFASNTLLNTIVNDVPVYSPWSNNNYGYALAISSDNNRLFIGHFSATVENTSYSGLVQVLDRQSDGSWLKTATLTTNGTHRVYGMFGSALTCNPTGDMVYISEMESYSYGVAKGGGSVHAFKYDVVNGWVHKAKIVSDNVYPDGQFGISLAYDDTDKYLVIGQAQDSLNNDLGSVHYVNVASTQV